MSHSPLTVSHSPLASSRLPARLRARRLGGYSLVELLVALLIALFLLGGLLTIVQSMRNTYFAQSGLAQLEDNERLAMIMMTNVIQDAGYFPSPTSNTIDSALPAVGSFQQGQPFLGTSGAAAPGDTFSVRFQTASGDSNINCVGGTNTSGANVTYTNMFSVDADGNLDCTLSINGVANAPVSLVSGVEDLQVWYGVKTNFATADNNVDTYLTAAQMTTADWSNVTAVKIRLTFTNPLAADNPSQPTTNYIECVVGVMARTGVTT